MMTNDEWDAIREVTGPEFIWGALDNVHDAETTLDDYAAAVSRAQRAALAASRAHAIYGIYGQYTPTTVRADTIIAASKTPDPVVNTVSCQPGDRYQHIKRGTTYQIVARGKLQTDTPLTDYTEVVAYRSEETGDVWVRPKSEFTPDRFRALPAAPVAEAQPVAWRWEATSEHIARDMREGRFPEQSERQRVAVAPPMQPTIGGAELDALVRHLQETGLHYTLCQRAADAITALRAQPDWKAMAERLGACVRIGDHGGIIWRPGPTRAALSDLAKMRGRNNG